MLLTHELWVELWVGVFAATLFQVLWKEWQGRRAPSHDSLCAYHLNRAAAAKPDQEALAAELLQFTGSLAGADEVNILLGNLIKQFACTRIDRKEALAIAYVSQLLLNSRLPAIAKECGAARDETGTQELMKLLTGSQQPRVRPEMGAKEAAEASRRTVHGSSLAGASDFSAAAPCPASQTEPARPTPGIPCPHRDLAGMHT